MSGEAYAEALKQTKAGRPVFPCYEVRPDGTCSCGKARKEHPGARIGKHPRPVHGFYEATCDLDQLARWNQQWPHADWAMRTGLESGIVVIDVDPRNDGHLSLEILEDTHGKLPETWHCLTGGGGDHFWYKHPQTDRTLASHLAHGIDFKRDLGYVMLPGSGHELGGTYAWELSSHPDDTLLADLPGWALELVTKPAARPQALSSTEASLPIGRRALRFIAFGAPSGEQRLEALAAARNLLANGFDVDSTAAKLFQGMVNCSNNPDEPWTYDDALEIATDIASRPAPPITDAAAYKRTWRDRSGDLHIEGIRVRV